MEDISIQTTPGPGSNLTGSKFLKKPSSKSPTMGSGKTFVKKSQTSSIEPGSGSKFIKKPQASNDGVVLKNSFKKPLNQPMAMNKAQMLLAGQRSNVSNKTAAIVSTKGAAVSSSRTTRGPTTGKVKPRSTTVSHMYSFETDSDDSMSMSLSRSASSRLELRSSSSDSFKIGRDGNKFLKKKKEEPPGMKYPEVQTKTKIETHALEPKKNG